MVMLDVGCWRHFGDWFSFLIVGFGWWDYLCAMKIIVIVWDVLNSSDWNLAMYTPLLVFSR